MKNLIGFIAMICCLQFVVIGQVGIENMEFVSDDGTKWHVVQSGQTLYAIARQHNVPISQIQDLNNLDGSTIYIGQRLLVSKDKPKDRGMSSASDNSFNPTSRLTSEGDSYA